MNIGSIKNILGKPYFETEECAIYNGDCLELMKKMEKSIIGLTVTSPPYNIGKAYEKVLPVEDYVKWCAEWIKEIHRLSKSNGSFWLNVGYLEMPERAKALPIAYLLWDKTDFYMIQEVIWNYSAGVAGRKFFSPRNEKLLWYVKDANNYVFNYRTIQNSLTICY